MRQLWAQQAQRMDPRDPVAWQEHVANQSARWGADQELNECCHLLRLQGFDVVDDLRATRRPKPPSLKEQALKTLQKLSVSGYPCSYQGDEDWDTIRKALEALPE